MTIRDCPKCGGDHFGSFTCPMEDPPGTHAPKPQAPSSPVPDVVREWEAPPAFASVLAKLNWMQEHGDRMAADLTAQANRIEGLEVRAETECDRATTAEAESDLREFVRESNSIEGILRSPTKAEIEAHEIFLSETKLGVNDFEAFVAVVAPGKLLRVNDGMNVRVGTHVAPRGGTDIVRQLDNICRNIIRGDTNAQCFAVHRQYETLHPFIDGNGRSGRVLWLWMMGGIQNAPLGFLHHWYYQSLEFDR